MKLTEKMREEMREMRKQGMSYREIAEKFGVNKMTVMYWCNDKVRQRIINNVKKLLEKKSKEEKRIYAREYRKKNPEKYNYMMARHYLKKLSYGEREKLVREIEEKGGLLGKAN